MSQKQISYDRLTIQHFWRATQVYKKELFASYLIPVYAISTNTIAPFIVGKILASLLVPHHSVQGYIIAFIVVGLVAFFSNWIGYWGFMKAQAKIIANLQAECLAMLLKRGTSFHNNQVSGKLVSEAMDFPNAYSQLATTLFTNLIPFAVSIISGVIIIFYNSLILGGLIAVMTVVAIGTGIYFRNKTYAFRQERIVFGRAVTSQLADSLVNIQAVKTFAREDDEMATHKKLSAKLRDSRIMNWGMFAKNGTERIGILLLFELAFILITVMLVHRDPSLLAAGIFAFSYTVTLTNRLFDIGTIMRSVEESFILAEPMTRAFQEKVEVTDAPNARALAATQGTVTFDAVNFHYDDSDGSDDVFSDLTVTIKPGEKIGLVGPSGGGKSTITRLLLRYEDIQSGSISIDGQDISQVTQTSLRQAIAYVPQESLLFHRTIAENIAYGNLEANEKMVIKAAKDAYAHDFIMGLPKGYETVVGERGVKLSGGQRQRIAIARAMLKNAPILLLDEATSALDSESEKVIQEALRDLMEKRTAIVIAHRLSTIQQMDRIVVLDSGKIIETGTHKQLLKQGGLYAKLWAHQSGGFIET